MMHIADQDIGGARVRRRFSCSNEAMIAGRLLTAKEVVAIPTANRRALIDAGYIEVFPRSGGGERFIMRRSGGTFDVVEGTRLNDQPLTREEAEALAARSE